MSKQLICGSFRKLGSRGALAGVVGVAVTLALPPAIGQVAAPWSITPGETGQRPVARASGGVRVVSKTSARGAGAAGARRPVAGAVSRASTRPQEVVRAVQSQPLAATFNPVPSLQRIRSDIVIRDAPGSSADELAGEEYWLRIDASRLREVPGILGEIPQIEEPSASEGGFACGDCGQQVADDADVCPKCGARFD